MFAVNFTKFRREKKKQNKESQALLTAHSKSLNFEE